MRLSKKGPSTTARKTKTKPSTSTKKQSQKPKVNKSKYQIIEEVAAEFDLKTSSSEYKLINNLGDFLNVVEKIDQVQPPVMAVDTETEGLQWKHRVIGVSFTFSEEENYYIPFRHHTEEFQPDIEDFIEGLNYIFNLPYCEYVFHNYKFDRHKLEKDGIVLSGKVHDTMLMHYVINENESHALKELAVKHLDPDANYYEKVIKDFRRKLARKLSVKLKDFGYEHIPIDIMVEYACRDTLFTYQLFFKFRDILAESEDLQHIYELELDTLDALAVMERNGAKLDTDILATISERLGEDIEVSKKEVWEMVGQEFELASTMQLRNVLKSKGIHTHRTTPTGAMSTDVASLRNVARRFPFVQKILDFRAKTKLKGSYADPLPSFCDENGRIHCSYRQAVAKTGRISCTSPSLQVIPRNTGENDIRRAFVPPDDDHIMIFIDLSQIELRMTAHYSKDPILLNAYLTGEDIHSRTAAEIFDVDINEVTKAQRTIAKPINFGIIYGIGPNKLAETLEISPEEARFYIEMYLQRYAGVASFIDKYQRLVKKHGYVKSYFGRVRHLDHLLDPDLEDWKKQRGYRQAVNYVIQGCQHPDTPILTDQGYIPIKDLDGELIKTYGGYTEDYKVFPCGKQQCYQVKTNLGSTINSPDHKFFVYNNEDIELRDAKDLNSSDHVLYELSYSAESSTPSFLTDDEIELCGLFCHSGNFPSDESESLYFKVPLARHGHLNWVSKYLAERWPEKWDLKLNGDLVFGVGNTFFTQDKDIQEVFRWWGVSGVTSCSRMLPDWVLGLTKNQKGRFLRGLFSSAAYFSNNHVHFKCPSYAYANSLQLLLTTMGILATIKVRNKDRVDRRYLVRISPRYVFMFKALVGSRDAYTLQMVERSATDGNSELPKRLVQDVGRFIRDSTEYHTNAGVKDEDPRLFTPLDQSYLSQMVKRGYGRRGRIIRILQKLYPSKRRLNFLDLLSRNWARVEEVTDLKESVEMLDIEINGEDHAYVARGFYQHNSCADMFKMTMSRLNKYLADKKSEMVINIHDEVIFYWHKDEIDKVIEVKEIFEDWNFRVPIVAEVQYSETSWGEKKEI